MQTQNNKNNKQYKQQTIQTTQKPNNTNTEQHKQQTKKHKLKNSLQNIPDKAEESYHTPSGTKVIHWWIPAGISKIMENEIDRLSMTPLHDARGDGRIDFMKIISDFSMCFFVW